MMPGGSAFHSYNNLSALQADVAAIVLGNSECVYSLSLGWVGGH